MLKIAKKKCFFIVGNCFLNSNYKLKVRWTEKIILFESWKKKVQKIIYIYKKIEKYHIFNYILDLFCALNINYLICCIIMYYIIMFSRQFLHSFSFFFKSFCICARLTVLENKYKNTHPVNSIRYINQSQMVYIF